QRLRTDCRRRSNRVPARQLSWRRLDQRYRLTVFAGELSRRAAERDVTSLENLVNHVNRTVGTNLSRSNGEEPVQERVFRRGSLETWQRAKVGSSCCSVVTDALERHVDECAVVGLERHAQVEFENAIRASDRPVIATCQYPAAQPVAVE